jgi:hypothetical protein
MTTDAMTVRVSAVACLASIMRPLYRSADEAGTHFVKYASFCSCLRYGTWSLNCPLRQQVAPGHRACITYR